MGKQHEDYRDFGRRFAELKHEAGRLGLFGTMQAMDAAQAVFGTEATVHLEIADSLKHTDKAAGQ